MRWAGLAGVLGACSNSTPSEPPASNGPSIDQSSDGDGSGSDGKGSDSDDVESPSGGEGGEQGPEPMLRIGELGELPARTTPEALGLELVQDIDHVQIHATLEDAAGSPVSECREFDVYRVGPSAVSWPLGTTLLLPLDYTETLPPGIYTQTLRLLMSAGDYVPLDDRTAHFFEVDANGLHPITSTEYTALVTPTTNGPNGPEYVGVAARELPPDPCPPFALPTDVMTGREGTSRVDFDAWSNIDTIQPFRWHPATSGQNRGVGVPVLEFYARDASAARIALDIDAPSDMPDSDFEVTRTIPSGTIRGAWILE